MVRWACYFFDPVTYVFSFAKGVIGIDSLAFFGKHNPSERVGDRQGPLPEKSRIQG